MSFSDPQRNLSQLDLSTTMTAVDLGAGAGSYSLLLARALSHGEVYAVDIQKELLERIKKEADNQGLENLKIIWGDIEEVGGTKLSDQIADVVVIANVLFQTKGAYTLALEAKRVLKPGGKILVVDWSDSFGGLGPKADDIITAEKAKAVFAEAGLGLEKEFEAGDHHWGLIFTYDERK